LLLLLRLLMLLLLLLLLQLRFLLLRLLLRRRQLLLRRRRLLRRRLLLLRLLLLLLLLGRLSGQGLGLRLLLHVQRLRQRAHVARPFYNGQPSPPSAIQPQQGGVRVGKIVGKRRSRIKAAARASGCASS
jgi:hypothetical protein